MSSPAVPGIPGLRGVSRSVVIGIGGGADVVGTIPTLDLLDTLGIDWVAGGLSWERIVYDPVPGPRRVADLLDAEPLALGVVFAGPNTHTTDGVRFAESGFSAACGRPVLLFDLEGGVAGVSRSIRAAIQRVDADCVIGIDVGGDSLASGEEPGLRSPLCDSILLGALADLAGAVPCLLGVFGYGSDGELTQPELDVKLATAAEYGGLLGAWGTTPSALQQLDRTLEVVGTEASRIPASAAHGALGETVIRNERRVLVNPMTTVTFYLDPVVVLQHLSPLARAVAGSTSLEAANAALHGLGLRTELDRERWMVRQGLRDYAQDRRFQAIELQDL